jgi:hypothetical protein
VNSDAFSRSTRFDFLSPSFARLSPSCLSYLLHAARSEAARAVGEYFPKIVNNDRNRIFDSEQSRECSRSSEDHSRLNAQLRSDRRRKEGARQSTLRHRRANLRNNRNQGRSAIKGRPIGMTVLSFSSLYRTKSDLGVVIAMLSCEGAPGVSGPQSQRNDHSPPLGSYLELSHDQRRILRSESDTVA